VGPNLSTNSFTGEGRGQARTAVVEQRHSITVDTTLEATAAIANELLNKRRINLQFTVYVIVPSTYLHDTYTS